MKFTDKVIYELIQNLEMKKISVSQGYTNCSIAVIDENSVIVTDRKIAQKLIDEKMNVLLLEDVPTIKLINDKNQYSKMNGFIGGAIARIENKIVIFGDLNKIDKEGKISQFIQKCNLEIVDFKGLDVIDYGGIIVL